MDSFFNTFGPQPRGGCFVGFDDASLTTTSPTTPLSPQSTPVTTVAPDPPLPSPPSKSLKRVLPIDDDKKSDMRKKKSEKFESQEDYSDLVAKYKRDGFVVVPKVLNEKQIAECRKGFHEDLKMVGVDYNNLRGCIETLRKVQTHPSGGMPFYYSPWRTKYCTLNKKLFEVTQSLWKETWAISAPGFECPYAPFDHTCGYAFIDSLNFRLPSSLVVNRVQRTIGPHIDINPWDHWGGRKGNVRWRPFQGFISLTDHTGGFMCCPGFHLEIKQYFQKQTSSHSSQGYISLHSSEYSDLHERMRAVHYKPGDAVIWDWRLAHRIAEEHPGSDTREVVYTSFFPDIQLNRNYVKLQLEAFREGKNPPEFMKEENKGQIVPGWDPSVFRNLTEFEEKLLGIRQWKTK